MRRLLAIFAKSLGLLVGNMSNHEVSLVQVYPETHPNADKLDVCKVFGYSCVVGKGQFEPGAIAAFIPPDSLVDTNRPEFSFDFLKKSAKLDGLVRIKCQRLRGVLSEGLLIPFSGAAGENVADKLGVVHYEPAVEAVNGEPHKTGVLNSVVAPPGREGLAKYDVENFKRYGDSLEDGEIVAITEKIHGANGRWCYSNGQYYAGSRGHWYREDKSNIWWKALYSHPEIKAFCKANPNLTVYGEAYGNVQALRYGIPNQVKILVFDIMEGRDNWKSVLWRYEHDYLPWVPLLYLGPLVRQDALQLAEGASIVSGAGHVREGVVVKPIVERRDNHVGRVQLKIIGEGYYNLKEA